MKPPSPCTPSRRAATRPFAGTLLCCLVSTASAGTPDVVVRVSGISPPLGQIGCALFSDAAGFPMVEVAP